MHFVICIVPPSTIVAHMHFCPASFLKTICAECVEEVEEFLQKSKKNNKKKGKKYL